MNPAMLLERAFMDAADADKDGKITHAEFTKGLAKWFSKWDTAQSGSLTEEQLGAGINRDLAPSPGGRPPI